MLGLGNLLLGDEGAGIHVINRLKKIKLPLNVEVIDGGTTGFELISIFNNHKKDTFLIIDAIAVPSTLKLVKNICNDFDTENVKNNTEELHVQGLQAAKIENKEDGKEEKEKPAEINNKGNIYIVPIEKLYRICQTNYDSGKLISFHQIGLYDILSLLRKTFSIKIKGYLIGINIFNPDTDSEMVNLKYSLKLSNFIRKKIPDIIDIILRYIKLLK